jgi:hypothetical protein
MGWASTGLHINGDLTRDPAILGCRSSEGQVVFRIMIAVCQLTVKL